MLSPGQVEFRRLLLFTGVGTVNTGVCYGFFALLVYLDCHYNLALAADYVFGIGLGYVLHRLSTFSDRKHVKQAFGKYALVLVATFLVNLVLLDWIVYEQWLDPLPGQAVAMIGATLLSYLLQKHWVFRSHETPEKPEVASQAHAA